MVYLVITEFFPEALSQEEDLPRTGYLEPAAVVTAGTFVMVPLGYVRGGVRDRLRDGRAGSGPKEQGFMPRRGRAEHYG